MIILEDVALSHYSKMKVGGRADRVYVPESVDELVNLVKNDLSSVQYYKIARGSNVLISDTLVIDHLIDLNQFNQSVIIHDGSVTLGASVSLQKAILEINRAGYGGIEYLFSVPGTVGGAVYMNAGRGLGYGQSISDYIQSVKVFDGERIQVLSKDECEFSYRSSVFHKHPDWMILEVHCDFEKGTPESYKIARRERTVFTRDNQDNRDGNLGSIFKVKNPYIMRLLSVLSVGWKDVYYTNKTSNWIINKSPNGFSKIILLIKLCQWIHWMLFQKCELEIEIWQKK